MPVIIIQYFQKKKNLTSIRCQSVPFNGFKVNQKTQTMFAILTIASWPRYLEILISEKVKETWLSAQKYLLVHLLDIKKTDNLPW